MVSPEDIQKDLPRSALAATFDVADDLLWQAEAGRLPGRGAITVGRSGQIGPLVELAFAARAAPAG